MKKTTNPAAAQKPEKRACSLAARRAAGPPLRWLAGLWGVLWLLAGGPALGQSGAARQTGPGHAAEVFIKAVASDTSVYAGQALTVRYLLYHRVPLIDPDNDIALTFKNCSAEEYPPAPPETKEIKETIGGQVYRVVLLKKYLLIPQLAGVVQLPALAQRYSFSAPPAPDDFFGEPRLVSKTIRSVAVRLPVRALPAPADSVAFCGAVGQFQGRPTYTVSGRAANLLTVQLQLSGIGNGQNIRLLAPVVPAGLDVFNVRHTAHHVLTAQGPQATYTYSYEVLAAYRGAYTLPGIALSYFDPQAARYVPLTSPAYHWRVSQGLPAPAAALRPAAALGQGEVLYTKTTLTQDQAAYWFVGSRACSGLLLAASLLWVAGLAYAYYGQVRAANSKAIAARKAKKQAIQALRKLARVPAPEVDTYYKALATILLTYLSGKLDLPVQAFGPQDLPEVLAAGGVPAPLRARTVAYLGRLRQLRFSAGGPVAQGLDFYREDLVAIIQQLDGCLHDQLSPQLVAAA